MHIISMDNAIHESAGKDGHLIDLRLLNQSAAGLTVTLSALVVQERS